MNRELLLSYFEDCDFTGYIAESNFTEKIINPIRIKTPFTYITGASKICISLLEEENFIIKIPFNSSFNRYDCKFFHFCNANGIYNHEWDYCLTELLTFNYFKSKKIEDILCKTRLLGVINNYPIYIQEKAEIFSDITDEENRYSDYRTPSIKSYCEKENLYTPNWIWAADALAYYGKKKFNKFMKSIVDIGDLHESNIGYVKGRPVLVDFSDFND